MYKPPPPSVSSDRFYLIGDVFPVAGIVLVFSLICAIIVALTSKNEKPPIYHCVSDQSSLKFVIMSFQVYATFVRIVAAVCLLQSTVY